MFFALVLLLLLLTCVLAVAGYKLLLWLNKKDPRIHGYDPYHVSANITNGSLGFEEKDDTVINGVIRLDKFINKQDLIDLFRRRHVFQHKAFCCIPTTIPRGSSKFAWKPVEHFNVSAHFIEHYDASSASVTSSCQQETDKLVEKICNDNAYIRNEGKKMPWWRVHLIREKSGEPERSNNNNNENSTNNSNNNNNNENRNENRRDNSDRGQLLEQHQHTIIVLSIHHAIVDGLACLRILSSILDSDDQGTPLDQNDSSPVKFSPSSRGAGGAGGEQKTRDPFGNGARGLYANLFTPMRWPQAILETLDYFYCALFWSWVALGSSPDTRHPLMLSSPSLSSASLLSQLFLFSPRKHEKMRNVMVPMPRHSLDLIKKIKNAAGKGYTVNDVEYALYAGTMRRYLLKFGGFSEKQLNSTCSSSSSTSSPSRFRSMTPFNVPLPISEGSEFSQTAANTWTFLINDLPLSPKNAKERLTASHKLWQPIKKRSFVPAAFGVTALAGDLGIPHFFIQVISRLLFAKCSVIFSNLPGPQNPEIFLCGAKILSANAFHPCAVPMAIVISMNGEMHYSLTVPMNEELSKKEGTDGDVRVALPRLFLEELDELRMEMKI